MIGMLSIKVREKINAPSVLRKFIEKDEIILAPGAYDPLSARMIEFTGFDVSYISGFGSSGGLLGFPDVGLMTMTEMVDNARNIAEAINIPVIADGDTGYGNQINVIRTVQEFEKAGVAGLQLEDQIFPKKCGHMMGKQVIAENEMVEKIKAAKYSQRNRDFLIVARTDAIAVEGLDSAISRAKAFYKAGADILFVEAPEEIKHIEKISKELRDYPLVFNWAEGGRSPKLTLQELQKYGFKIVIFPVSTLMSATKAMGRVLESIKKYGTPEKVLNDLYDFQEFLQFIGLPEINQLENEFGVTVQQKEPV